MMPLSTPKLDTYRIQMRFVPLSAIWEWHDFFACQDEMAAHICLRVLREGARDHEYRAVKIG